VNADGTELQPITQFFEDRLITNLVWSPDGKKLVFWKWDRNNNWPNPSIGGITLASKELKVLAVVKPKAQSYMENGYIVWSPNGKWIAFFTF
jgi:Tol biopolymer transport system component